jgi:hypothetical protein
MDLVALDSTLTRLFRTMARKQQSIETVKAMLTRRSHFKPLAAYFQIDANNCEQILPKDLVAYCST